MAALSKLFGRAKMTYKGVEHQPPISECCVNRELMPRWRGPDVMEDDRYAMGYVCHACGREFLPSSVRNRRLTRGPVSVPSAAEVTHAEQPTPDDDLEGAEAPASEDESTDGATTDEDKA